MANGKTFDVENIESWMRLLLIELGGKQINAHAVAALNPKLLEPNESLI